MFAIVVAYAICFTAIKTGLIYAPPFLFSALRVLIGGVAIMLTLWFLKLPLWPERKLWPWILVMAVTATTINYAAMFLSAGRTGAGIASILGNMQPLFIVVMATVFLGERLSKSSWLSLILSLIGIVIIFSPTYFESTIYGIAGPFWAVVASISAAIGSVLMKYLGQPTAVLLITAWQFLVGSIPLFFFSWLTELPNYNSILDLKFIVILFLLALFGTAFGSVAWYLLIQRCEIGRLSLGFFLVPVFGLGLALMLGERLTSIEMLGAGVVIIAILVSLLPQTRKLSTDSYLTDRV
ncbi:MAG TPA: DMT family transporter [Candidatus Paceibacterota bacterium]